MLQIPAELLFFPFILTVFRPKPKVLSRFLLPQLDGKGRGLYNDYQGSAESELLRVLPVKQINNAVYPSNLLCAIILKYVKIILN